jgi:hypothetical protein
VEATLTKKTSLVDHLVWQLRLSPLSAVEVEAAVASDRPDFQGTKHGRRQRA